jgi:hypothetical protein
MRYLVCLLLAVVMMINVRQVSAEAVPKLTVENPTVEFGTVKEGAPVEAVFRLKNNGTAPLELRSIQPACGCTVAASSSSVIAPGATSEVRATFDTAGFQGPKVKTIRIYTNDPQQPTSVLTLRGTVLEEILVDPPRVYFGNVTKGDSPSKALSLLTNAGTDIQVNEVSTRSEHLSLQVEDAAREGKLGKRILVTLRPSAPVGAFRATVLARTTSTQRPLITIPVFAQVQGKLRLVPSYVSFDLLDGPLEKAVSKTIEVQNDSAQRIAIQSVESDNPSVLTQVREVEPGKLYEITVSLAEGSIGTIRAKVTILTTYELPAEGQLTLPVYAIVARKGD